MTSDLRVVGIDAVVSNSEGAHKRNSKIQKVFKFATTNQEDYVHDNTTTNVISSDTVSASQNGLPKGAKQNYLPLTKYVHVDRMEILLAEVEQLSGGCFTASQVNIFNNFLKYINFMV